MARTKLKVEIWRELNISVPHIISHYGLRIYMGITVVNTDRKI